MKPSLILSIGLLSIMVLTGGSCKKDPPVGPPACDTCKTDTTHHTGPNDTTSHTFTWSQYTLPNEGILTGAWVFGPKNVWVVGGAVWKWDGTSWKDVSPSLDGTSLSGELSGFSFFGFSETNYWLIHGGIIFHSNGPAVERFNTVGGLHNMWGPSYEDMYAVGDGGTILHFDGTSWTKMQSGTTKNLYSIWGTNDQNIWAAGWDVHHAISEILHYDGTSWTKDVLASNGEGYKWGLGEVWACDSAGSHVTFVSGSQLFRKTGSGIWREDDSDKIGNRYSDGGYDGVGIKGNSPNDLIAAGNSGFIAHWNGKSWHSYPDFFDASSLAIGLAGMAMKDNTACLVGDNNGASWIAIGQR